MTFASVQSHKAFWGHKERTKLVISKMESILTDSCCGSMFILRDIWESAWNASFPHNNTSNTIHTTAVKWKFVISQLWYSSWNQTFYINHHLITNLLLHQSLVTWWFVNPLWLPSTLLRVLPNKTYILSQKRLHCQMTLYVAYLKLFIAWFNFNQFFSILD